MKKGDPFVLTSGDYSDYTIRAHFRATKDFLFCEAYSAYIESLPMVPVLKYGEMRKKDPHQFALEMNAYEGRPKNSWGIKPSQMRYVKFDTPIDTGEIRKEYSSIDGFNAFLIREGYVEEFDCPEYNFDFDTKKE
jgi:hypothetical protein